MAPTIRTLQKGCFTAGEDVLQGWTWSIAELVGFFRAKPHSEVAGAREGVIGDEESS